MLSRFAGSFWRAQGVRLAIFVMAAAALATGQITFNDFQSTTGLTLNGDAARSGNVLRLTPAAVGKVGSAWFNNAQTVNQGFTTKFTFQFSQPNPAGDGIAFVIQNSGAGALGGGGGSIGYGAIGPCPDGPSTCSGGIIDSVAIEFDTFNNGAATGDPAQNHIAVQSGGIGETNCPAHVSPNTDDFPNCLIGTVSTIGTNMSDGNPHTVVIDYAAPSCDGDCGPGTLTVKLDDVTVLTTNLTLENEMNLSEGGTALVGFTSATGSAFENHDILNWVFTPHGQTMTIGPLHTSGGHTTVFSFGTFNFKSAPATTISAAGDDL